LPILKIRTMAWAGGWTRSFNPGAMNEPLGSNCVAAGPWPQIHRGDQEAQRSTRSTRHPQTMARRTVRIDPGRPQLRRQPLRELCRRPSLEPCDRHLMFVRHLISLGSSCLRCLSIEPHGCLRRRWLPFLGRRVVTLYRWEDLSSFCSTHQPPSNQRLGAWSSLEAGPASIRMTGLHRQFEGWNPSPQSPNLRTNQVFTSWVSTA
jgi:hypothetical protein